MLAGSTEIDRMRKVICQTVAILKGILEKKTIVLSSEKFCASEPVVVWRVYMEGAEIRIVADVGKTTLLVDRFSATPSKIPVENVMEVYENLPLLLAGVISISPEVKKTIGYLFNAARSQEE